MSETDERAIPARYQDEETIRALLREAKTIAVVGLSPDPSRPSHGVARYLQAQGYRIVPVNPREQTLLGETSYAALSDHAAQLWLVGASTDEAQAAMCRHVGQRLNQQPRPFIER